MENVQNNVIDINNIKPDKFMSVDLDKLAGSAHSIIGNSSLVFKYLQSVNKLDASYEPMAIKASTFMQKMVELSARLLNNEEMPAEIINYNITDMAQLTFECMLAIVKIHFALSNDTTIPEEVAKACDLVNEKGIELLLMINQEK